MQISPLRSTLAGVALGAFLAGAAQAGTARIDYAISLAGLPLGKADLSSTLEGDRYTVGVNAKLTGLVGMVAGGSGSATATGAVSGGRAVPATFAITGRTSSSERTLRMGLPGGNVAGIDVQPPLEERSDRVPLTEAHKRGILDPLGAVVMTVAGGSPMAPENCKRTIPVFDGTARFNVVLSHGGTRAFEVPGYKGQVLVCEARYVPIAGHRANRPAVKFMAENRDMSVWLAPVEGGRVLLPVRISVKTMYGTSVIEAQRLTGVEGQRAAR